MSAADGTLGKTKRDASANARASAVEEAIAALEDVVLDELRPGSQLPAEAELARMLSVSRLTVREAVRALEARGLLSLRRGRRAVVRTPNGALLGDFFRTSVRRNATVIFELIELRRALEPHIAGLAAMRATSAERASMQAAVAEMDALASSKPVDEEAFHAVDLRFHGALASASGNTMLMHLIEELAQPLGVSRRYTWRGRERDERPLAPVIEAHRRILTAVLAGDSQMASAAMLTHLDETERDLLAASAIQVMSRERRP